MNSNFDVVIVGAGPIGITLSNLVKALNQHTTVCVLDKRVVGTRKHGLSLNKDALDEIQNVLNLALQTSKNISYINSLKDKISEWEEKKFVSTSYIEETLAMKASEVGVTILRGPEYEINKNNYDLFFDENNESELATIIKNCKIIIGADGSHSDIRKIVIDDALVDRETLNHLVELKYQTNGKSKPRGFFEASSNTSFHGNLSFETMSTNESNVTKPVTLHLMVSKLVYDKLRNEDDNGKIKGVFGNAYTIEELNELADQNEIVKDVCSQINSYIKNKRSKGYDVFDEKIATLTLTVYRSAKGAVKYKNKPIVLVGDARFGLVLERGCNTGLKVAAHCAIAINQYLKEPSDDLDEKFNIFHKYESDTNQIFYREKRWAKIKNTGVNIMRASAYSSHETSTTSINIIGFIKSLFSGSRAD